MECSVEGCERKTRARGYCAMHYQRVKATGVTYLTQRRPTAEQRFWTKFDVDDETGCWVWRSATSEGYGSLAWLRRGVKTREIPAHCFAYQLLVGPIPEGLEIDHLCRNRACCNPGHLEAVTPRENKMRGEGVAARQARKTECIRGHPLLVEGVDYRRDGRGARVCYQCASLRRRRYWRDKGY